MKVKEVLADGATIALSAALLWHFSNIWRYGQHVIQEPNTLVLTLETVGLVIVFAFGIAKLVST